MSNRNIAFAASYHLQRFRLTQNSKSPSYLLPHFSPLRTSRSALRVYHRAPMATMSASPTAGAQQFASLFPGGRAMVLANDGAEVNLVDIVAAKNNVVVLGWLRHYGCTLCKKQAADWIAMRAKLKARSVGPVSMILIGNGRPNQASDFAQEMGWEEDLFSDPSRATYQALAFNKGLQSLLSLSSLKKTINSFREGNSQTLSRIPTDPLQQGGALVVNRAGIVTLFHRDAVAGDHAEIDDLISAISAAVELEAQRGEQQLINVQS